MSVDDTHRCRSASELADGGVVEALVEVEVDRVGEPSVVGDDGVAAADRGLPVHAVQAETEFEPGDVFGAVVAFAQAAQVVHEGRAAAGVVAHVVDFAAQGAALAARRPAGAVAGFDVVGLLGVRAAAPAQIFGELPHDDLGQDALGEDLTFVGDGEAPLGDLGQVGRGAAGDLVHHVPEPVDLTR